jgi:peptide-methionine (S)-S-oxide reductase
MAMKHFKLRSWGLGGVAAAGAFALLAQHHSAHAETVFNAPPAAYNPADSATSETAILSGGCFWGMQGVFEHVKGVTRVVAGYTGGAATTAQYEIVSTGATGHAESVQITFNPQIISYAALLRIYVSVAADPTQLNYQGPDDGSQYRSEIWYTTPAQQKIAQSYFAQLAASHTFPAPIVVRVDPARSFYQAEGYHQDFLVRNPSYPYIAAYDIPKVAALKTMFPQDYSETPVTLQPVS